MRSELLPLKMLVRGDRFGASHLAAIVRKLNALVPIAGPGISLKSTPHGIVFSAAVTGLQKTAAADLAPFTVRYVVESDEIPYTGYEIYLPAGSVAVGASCLPLNPPALRSSDDNNSLEPLESWYRLPFVPESEESGIYYYVTIHAKTSSALDGVDRFDDWPRQYLWAEIVTRAGAPASSGAVGDSFSTTVGTVYFEEDAQGQLVRTIRHTVRTPVNVADSSTSQFRLNPVFSVDSTNLELSLKRLFVRNAAFSAAGSTFISHSLAEIDTDAEGVYLVIDSSTTPYTAEVRSYKSSSSSSNSASAALEVDALADADKPPLGLSILLYRLDGQGHVTLDNRSALSNIQLYQ